jgi:hypothetical protein
MAMATDVLIDKVPAESQTVESAIDSTPAESQTLLKYFDKGRAAMAGGLSPKSKKILILVGASLALSATATGVALVFANREALGHRVRVASGATSRQLKRLAKVSGRPAHWLTAQVAKR